MTTQTNQAGGSFIDIKNILAGVITAALISAGSFVWFMGAFENRVANLEKDSDKVDKILTTVSTLSEKMAVMNTDLTYVKENMRDLKVNSSILSDDVRKLRSDVAEVQKGNK
ncbi:hypothetical protein DEEACLCL_00034 [Salmonella phage CRW-SP2]|nr:hypothetical protein DEEACLCL_00034 [Salmonella phage CRW-SP2]